MFIRFFCLLSLWVCSLVAHDEAIHTLSFPGITPWFTGPLLAPSAFTLKPGHYNIQPYIYCDMQSAKYNKNWNPKSQPIFYANTFQIEAKVGLSQFMDLQFYPEIVYNETQGQSYTGVGDALTGLNFQLVDTQIGNPWPAIKLSLKGSMPFGKYQHLESKRKKTDSIGAGSWLPTVTVVFGKIWNPTKNHYIDGRLAFTYQFGASVHVKGLNAYGGAPNTKGTAYPGNSFIIDAAFQYNLTQQWAVACDFYYSHVNRNRFSGRVGTTPSGQPATMTSPSSDEWSLAPAIEYNWSKNVGLLAGVWFSVAGRNATRFTNAIISLNVYH